MVNNPGFTQGPWSWSADRLESAVDWVAHPEYDNHSGWAYIEVSDDDKSLIAAAPEIYEALNNLLDKVNNDNETMTWFSDEQDEANRALAKARGEK